MKIRNILLILSTALIVSACGATKSEVNSNSSEMTVSNEPTSELTSSESSASSALLSSSEGKPSSLATSKESKVTVPSHTLSDSNPPINVESKGQIVNKNTWDSFRNASDSKFVGNYNYTYKAYSGGSIIQEKFTKNGYYIYSSSGSLYYERKSGSTFYEYSMTTTSYERRETTLNLQNKYVSRIKDEIYVHMFDFENYEYDEDDGTYRYLDFNFGSNVKFQGGYLTYLSYSTGGNFFSIEATFETTIEIPTSFYYQ